MRDAAPDLTLVIACYNEAEHLEASVARLLGVCDLLRLDYEVIFVDDASRDETQRL
ncbi:MAG: glycosyltransferase, partial [Acidobacteria bacterium]